MAARSGGFAAALESMVPGYSSYKEEEGRRAADRAIRDYLAGKLATVVRSLEALQSRAAGAGQLGLLSVIDGAKNRVARLTAKVKMAPPGYAGFFAARVVDVAKLDQVRGLDESLANEVSRIENAVAPIVEGELTAEALSGSIRELDAALSALESALVARDGLLTEVK